MTKLYRFTGAGAHHHNGHAARAIGTTMSTTCALLIQSALHWLELIPLYGLCVLLTHNLSSHKLTLHKLGNYGSKPFLQSEDLWSLNMEFFGVLPEGTICLCCTNVPGRLHDSSAAEWGRIYRSNTTSSSTKQRRTEGGTFNSVMKTLSHLYLRVTKFF